MDFESSTAVDHISGAPNRIPKLEHEHEGKKPVGTRNEQVTYTARTAKAGRCAGSLASSRRRLCVSTSSALSTFTSIA